ncbi:auxin-induced protein x10a [Phtheirospermum japonicum]|uniref:Auxin-induced protein x10a n=1 Tax=Phtheirospermum japonicum TaxID=374723 RepID=A0A830CZE0_9LAMI|nr:auxin-induced protein x10a [Phtheirospermum japonicum]GFQ00376.1 auxin-induced protein x10a [Phtheirospermum japonicum]
MKTGWGYIRVGQDPTQPDRVPKGHMTVYVGKKDGDFQRILVPVVYFNHPMFGDLLRESEKEYEFDQLGRLTIPCRISEFERVQTRIEQDGVPGS